MITCVLGCDHAGLSLTREIADFLNQISKISDVVDNDLIDIERIIKIFPQDSTKVDYPDFAKLVCNEVLNNKNYIGILVCGSGIGMSISANKISGIRAALCLNEYMAKYARMHNDANILCLAERILGVGIAKDIVKAFLQSKFEGGRHQIRIDKINLLDK